ncbi:MAG: hypothetical protein ACYTFW_11930 [Planctomycetota bacterium]|jgi:hypothetical protein
MENEHNKSRITMENEHNKSRIENAEKLKEIPKWTRKYAQNRTLTILVLLVMIGLFSMLIAALVGFLLALAVTGFWKGNIILGCIGAVALVAVLAALVKFYIFIFVRPNNRSLDIRPRRIHVNAPTEIIEENEMPGYCCWNCIHGLPLRQYGIGHVRLHSNQIFSASDGTVCRSF